MSRIINDWEPETRSLLESLIAAGFTLHHGNDGEEEFKFTEDMAKTVERLTATDEASLFVVNPAGKNRWLWLVYGNEPGVLVSDYTCDEGLDKITEAHFKKWDGQKQPTKTQD